MNQTLWLTCALLIAADLVITAMRASLVRARLPLLLTMRDTNPSGVDRTVNLLEQPDLPAALRLAVILVHFLLGAGVAWLAVDLGALHTNGLQVFGAAAVFALVMLAFEYALEGAVQTRLEAWAVRMTPLGNAVRVLLRPLTWGLGLLSRADSRGEHKFSSVTEDELKNWVEDERPESTLEKGERRMIYSIFQFGDTLVREIMIPRIDVFSLDVNTSTPEAVQAALLSGHSRLPVYEDSIDNIIGLLYAKDLLRLQLVGEGEKTMRALLRQAYFVPETKKVDELLREMQARGVHMAIVVDEYGGTAGVVTLEDIVEEIVGEIRDEYDQGEELLFQQISPDEYLFQGRVDLEDVNDVLGTHLTRDVADTLGGYIYGELGRVPVGNEKVSVEDWQLTVEQVSGRRIRLVRAVRVPHTGEIEEKEDETER